MPHTASFRTLLLTTISIAALSACSTSDSSSANKTAAPMPPISEMDMAMNSPAPQSLSASDTVTPVMPSAETSSSETDRIARLEQSVDALRADYNRIMPAFASLNTTNERIQTLLSEIEKDTGKASTITATPPMATTKVTTITKPGTVSSSSTVTASATVPTLSAPPLSSFKAQPTAEEARAEAERQMSAAKTASLPETKTEAKIAPAAGAGANSVKGVRIGEHDNKTRLVLDLAANTKPEFKYDLDNGEKVLLVELPSSGWNGVASGKPKSPLIESWAVQKGENGGSILAIQLKKDARVLSTEFLKQEGPDSARLVMDIASAS